MCFQKARPAKPKASKARAFANAVPKVEAGWYGQSHCCLCLLTHRHALPRVFKTSMWPTESTRRPQEACLQQHHGPTSVWQPSATKGRRCHQSLQDKHAQVARETAANQQAVEGQRRAIEAARECFVAMCRAFTCANRDRGAQSFEGRKRAKDHMPQASLSLFLRSANAGRSVNAREVLRRVNAEARCSKACN